MPNIPLTPIQRTLNVRQDMTTGLVVVNVENTFTNGDGAIQQKQVFTFTVNDMQTGGMLNMGIGQFLQMVESLIVPQQQQMPQPPMPIVEESNDPDVSSRISETLKG
jgi:hypothetical protein